MANEKQLKILKSGVKKWNDWRGKNPKIKPKLSRANLSRVDLSRADLSGADLSDADLSDADLSLADLTRAILIKVDLTSANLRGAKLSSSALVSANLIGAKLSDAKLGGANLDDAYLVFANLSCTDLSEAKLRGAHLGSVKLRNLNLSGADLSSAHLSDTDLREAKLSGGDLSCADLSRADLRDANLSCADLSRADLRDANLSCADLSRADLSHALLAETTFVNVNLGSVIGLESCRHDGPSTLDHRTLMQSGPLPLAFLRGCGLPDDLIEYLPSLQGTAIQFYSCFISYSTKDQEFADRLYADLQNKGVRCWFAPEVLKIGDPFRQRIEEAIRLHERLLLILSEHSVKSDWVRGEVEAALEREQREKRLVLFPVRLDDAVMDTHEAWAGFVRRERHIGDFRNWTDHNSYKKGFERLLRDLKAERQASAEA